MDIAEDDWVALLESSGENEGSSSGGDPAGGEVVTSSSGVDLKGAAETGSVEADDEDLFRYSTLHIDEDVRSALMGSGSSAGGSVEDMGGSYSESGKHSPSRPTSQVFSKPSSNGGSAGGAGSKADDQSFFV